MFHNNGEPEVYMGSADWMSRNLRSRIEVVFPVSDKKLKQELIQILQFQLDDTKKAVVVKADYSNERISSQGSPIAAQEAIYQYVKELS
jgi:polyphosphate kinase